MALEHREFNFIDCGLVRYFLRAKNNFDNQILTYRIQK